jgi:8-oxo-dGTP pyrophosphatase MutT (NUDIX family)
LLHWESKAYMEMADYPEITSAGGVVISDDRKILFCHPTGSRWSNWRMPKGQVDPGESTKDAALREILEETGYRCKIRMPLITEVRYATSNRAGAPVMKRLVMYLIEPIEKVQEPDWEHDEFRWVTFDKIDQYATKKELALIEEAVKAYEELEGKSKEK